MYGLRTRPRAEGPALYVLTISVASVGAGSQRVTITPRKLEEKTKKTVNLFIVHRGPSRLDTVSVTEKGERTKYHRKSPQWE